MKKIAIVIMFFIVSITMNAQRFIQANIYYQTTTSSNDGAFKLYCVGCTEPIQFKTSYSYSGDTASYVYTGDSLSNLKEGLFGVIATDLLSGDTVGKMTFFISSPSFIMYNLYCNNVHVNTMTNSATSNTCDGSISLIPVLQDNVSNIYYYIRHNNNDVVLTDLNIENLCPGKYLFYRGASTTDTVIHFSNTFWIDAQINNPVNMHIDVNTVSTSTSCTGKAFASVNQGNPPYTYHWIGFPSVVTDSITGLCEGIYTLMVVDNNLDSAAVNYFIASDNNTFDNTNNTGYTASDTLFSYIQNCTIDYNVPIDSSYITSYSLLPDSMNLAYVLSVWQNGVLTELYDTLSVDSMNVNMFIIYIYCPAKSSANVIKVVDYVNVDKLSTVNNIKNDNQFTVYPNPAEKTIYIKTSEFSGSTVEIMNVDGKLLQQINLKSGFLQLSIDDLPAGIYFVKLRTRNDVFVRKFIKQN